jgi:hypothetical protein
MLLAWGAEDLEWVTAQLLTEVATNALLHARTPFSVRLEHDAARGLLRCAVTDHSPLPPRLRRHSPTAATGRGLRMLEQLSAGWGVHPEPDGKTVWFEVSSDGADGRPGVDATDEEPDLDRLLHALDPRSAPAPGPSGAADPRRTPGSRATDRRPA